MLPTNSLINLYNPATQTTQDLIDGFVIRQEEFQKLFAEIKKSDMKYPEQHYIIQGQRGLGKTTLLLRLYYEIKRDSTLSQWLIPIIFGEEQYHIRTLDRLWESIAEHLEIYAEFSLLYQEMERHIAEENYEAQCFSLLQQALRDNKKKLVIFIDNIDSILSKIGESGEHRLREVLMTTPDIRIIGASAVVMEKFYDYSKPFYEFFKIIQLEGLSKAETKLLLLKISERYKGRIVEDILERFPERVEALRRISGGVPRTIILLFEIFADNQDGNSFKDLELVLDRVTPLYKHRMDDLSPQQQAIVDAIALNLDAINVKDIAQKTRMESKAVSSQLNQLEKNKIINKKSTSNKNYLYQIAERFFNIWYLMRYGRKTERNKVKWYMQFLEGWCSEDELVDQTRVCIRKISDGNMHPQYVLLYTQALAETKAINGALQHELLTVARNFLSQRNPELLEELPDSDKELWGKFEECFDKKDHKNCIKWLLNMKIKSDKMFFLIGLLYYSENKFPQAERKFIQAIEHGNTDALYFLAVLYEYELKDYGKAKTNYLLAVDNGNVESMLKLARLYEFKYKDYRNAEKYYLLAVEAGNIDAMHELAYLKLNQNRNKVEALNLAIKSFAKSANVFSTHVLAMVLLWHNKYDESLDISKNLLASEEFIVKYSKCLIVYLMFLMSKKKYSDVLAIFQKSEYQLIDRFKPIYFALMYFMQEKYPNEYKKMGEEFRQTVEEIIKDVEQLGVDYI